MVSKLNEKGEGLLDVFGKRAVAIQFKKAIISDDADTILRLLDLYNPRFVHGFFEDASYFPNEVSVSAYATEFIETNGARLSDKTIEVIMRLMLTAIMLISSIPNTL